MTRALQVMWMALECEARTGAHIKASTPLWHRTLPARDANTYTIALLGLSCTLQ